MTLSIIKNIPEAMTRKPSDRFFIDKLQSLIYRKDLKYLGVQEPYYSIDESKLNGEETVFKAFFTIPALGEVYSFSKGYSNYPEADGVIIITTKRVFIHFKNTEPKREDIEANLADVQIHLQKLLDCEDTYNKVHSTTSSDKGPQLVIISGARKVNIILTIAINRHSNSIRYQRGFAGLIQYYAFIRMIKLLIKSDEQYYEEIKTYYDSNYGLMRPSTSSCMLLLAIIISFPIILVLVFISNILHNYIPSIIGIVLFFILFFAGIIMSKIQFNSVLPKDHIKPELLSDKI